MATTTSMATPIKFGTSGWRAIVAEDFTFANVRRAVTGIARYVISEKPQGARMIVGRDPRFLGEAFSEAASSVLRAHGITPLVTADAAPTPAIAYEIIRLKTDGAINFTASHNPPDYNGIKFSTSDGCPALPEVTRKIEAEIASLGGPKSTTTQKSVSQQPAAQMIDVKPAYLARLKEVVDVEAIRKGGLRVGYDPMWGAA